eukprot:TRINITY_DN62408_c0_g1_i1.p1 TRINITY_DN62408_c0_g1~~TRINITY_DN62408_c0_g1_i1.p1  ORF type:complete len:153 (-),score=28.09 TRINITY_DN62408_c0_g1_i1:85-543(-)
MKSVYGEAFPAYEMTDYQMNKEAAARTLAAARGTPTGKAPGSNRSEYRDFISTGGDAAVLRPSPLRVDKRANDSLLHGLGQRSSILASTARDELRWHKSDGVASKLTTRDNLELTSGRATDFWTSAQRDGYRWHGKPQRRQFARLQGSRSFA